MKCGRILEVLVEKHDLDFETWVRLIEIQAEESIKPNLDRFTLRKLGDLHLEGSSNTKGYSSMHEVSQDNPEFLSKGYLGDTQGIFGFVGLTKKSKEPCEEYAYGLTRQGVWVIITIDLEYDGDRKHRTGSTSTGGVVRYNYETGPYYRAVSVKVEESSVSEIGNRLLSGDCSPLYWMLRRAVNSWHERAVDNYNEANKVNDHHQRWWLAGSLKGINII